MARVFTIDYGEAVDLAKGAQKDGSYVRPADADEVLAAYEVINGKRAYGHAGPVFARKLLELGVEEVNARVSAALERLAGDYGSVEMRLVRGAALLVASGEIAQDCNLLAREIDVASIVNRRLAASIAQRSGHLDVDRQTLDALRQNVLRGLSSHSIVDLYDPPQFVRYETLGFWGHVAGNGKKDQAAYALEDEEDSFSALGRRTYILPVSNLVQLGVKAEPDTLARLLRESNALIEPSAKAKFAKSGLHETIPGVGKLKHVRVKGSFIHFGYGVEEAVADYAEQEVPEA